MSRPPWWDGGVNFACQPECGGCCDQPGGVVFLSRADIKRLSDRAGLDEEAWIRRDCTTSLNGRLVLRSRVSDGICIYLKGDKRCSVYEDRPQQCAAFPWWSENLRSMRAWRKVRRTCPGIDAPDALRVEGDVIRLHVARDLEAGRGVRLPLPPLEP